MADKLKVTIINPDKVLFQGEADFVMAPGIKGTLGLFPAHTPLYAELVAGEIYLKGEKEEIVAIENGILRLRNDEITVLAGI